MVAEIAAITCFVLAAAIWLWDIFFYTQAFMFLGWAFWRWKPHLFRGESLSKAFRKRPAWMLRWGAWTWYFARR